MKRKTNRDIGVVVIMIAILLAISRTTTESISQIASLELNKVVSLVLKEQLSRISETIESVRSVEDLNKMRIKIEPGPPWDPQPPDAM